MQDEEMDWDAFISHASEDKDSIVRHLAVELKAKGLRIWFDESTLTVGDSLRRSIDHGLARSRFGIVIISPDFMSKEWPQKELDGLVAREIGGRKVILPVWHNITADLIRSRSPMLADRVAVSSSGGLLHVAAKLLEAIGLGESSTTRRATILSKPESIMKRQVEHRRDPEVDSVDAEFQYYVDSNNLNDFLKNAKRILAHKDGSEEPVPNEGPAIAYGLLEFDGLGTTLTGKGRGFIRWCSIKGFIAPGIGMNFFS